MAKGILKGTQNDESLEFGPGLQLPTQSLSRQEVLENGNNTTSRINTLGLESKINRRVSFAPDVTLHSFDFVPEVKDVKLPRRKEKQDEDGGEESMELSQGGIETGSEMTMTQVMQPLQEMEMTEVFKPSESEPMELTQVQRVEGDGYEQMELTEVPQVPEKPEEPVRVHTPPPATPPPAKRSKSNAKATGDGLGEEEDDMELSLLRMSPIALRGSEREQRLSYSLKEFLDAVGVSFLIDTKFVKSQKAVEFPTTRLPVPMHADQILSRLYVDMPVLEMNAFVCKELWRRVDQSSVQFQDLENQISSSVPPLLFREYFESSNDMRRLMNEQLQLVKSFAKLESRKAWYDWRIQHLKGLQDVLLENLGLLQEEKVKLDRDLQRAQRNKQETLDLLQVVKNEVELVRDLPSQVYKKESKLADKLKLERMRQELRARKIAFNDSQNLQRKRQSVLKEVEERRTELSGLNENLYQLQQKNKAYFTEYNVKKLRRNLEMLGIISGVRFMGMHNSQLIVNCFDTIELSINLSLLPDSPRDAFQLSNDGELFRNELVRYLLSHTRMDNNFLTNLFVQLRKSVPLIKSYRFLKYLFPLSVSNTNGKTTIQLMDYDTRTNVKYLYNLSVQELINAVLDENSSVPISVKLTKENRDTEISLDVVSSRFLAKTAKIFPWANRKRIQMTTI